MSIDNDAQEVIDATVNVTKALKEALKDHTNIEFFPAMGNHDVFPANLLDFEVESENDQMNEFKETWIGKNWLTKEEAKVFNRHGFYKKKFPSSLVSNAWMVTVNNMACDSLNWWTMKNRYDPGG